MVALWIWERLQFDLARIRFKERAGFVAFAAQVPTEEQVSGVVVHVPDVSLRVGLCHVLSVGVARGPVLTFWTYGTWGGAS